MRSPKTLAVAFFVLLAGCYHATIETGLQPSAQTLEEDFASAWIYGLVPPATVDITSRCEHGAARIETQLSFVNQLVAWVTIGIYTPMTIKVTCAERPRALAPVDGAETVTLRGTVAERQLALTRAAEVALREGRPVTVLID